jgi:glutaredoxin
MHGGKIGVKQEIVMYVRSFYCPNVALARDVLRRYKIPFREINVDDSPQLAARLKDWTGFLSVPTIILANSGQDVPHTDFLPVVPGQSVRGTDRGSMITEPNNKQLENWLYKHNLLKKPYQR